MTITHVRQSHHSEWQARWRRDPCFSERPDERIRNFYREYVGHSGMKVMQGQFAPVFSRTYVIK